MSAENVTYVDASAIVKLAVSEPESRALRSDLSRRKTLVTSALARTEVARALLPLGADALTRGDEVLRRMHLLRVTDRVLIEAGRMEPAQLRSLDAIHLATAKQFGSTLKRVVTYDARMAQAASALGWSVSSPS